MSTLFSPIPMKWRRKPLISHQAIISLIATTTRTGLKVYARIDDREHLKGINRNSFSGSLFMKDCSPGSGVPDRRAN